MVEGKNIHSLFTRRIIQAKDSPAGRGMKPVELEFSQNSESSTLKGLPTRNAHDSIWETLPGFPVPVTVPFSVSSIPRPAGLPTGCPFRGLPTCQRN
jgi:hypothetical protein